MVSVIGLGLVLAAASEPGRTRLQTAWTSVKGDSSIAYSPSWSATDAHNLSENVFHVDPATGYEYPASFMSTAHSPYKRANACLLVLVRNSELEGIQSSMSQLEWAFNRKYHYPWVFLNDEPFTEDFKRGVKALTDSDVQFGLIPKEHWSYPEFIDQDKAAETRQWMKEQEVLFGEMESYHHMCRFNSGFFFKHPLVVPFDYYWRVEPKVLFPCDIDYDPFIFMQRNNKVYGFTITVVEFIKTITTLWDRVKEFAELHPEHIAADNAQHFMVDDPKAALGSSAYNLCHFWSNFEIADMRFWRSQAYQDFFAFLDQAGGFYYERWGDAPVHSIAASLFLPSSALHHFEISMTLGSIVLAALAGHWNLLGVDAILGQTLISTRNRVCSNGGELAQSRSRAGDDDQRGP